MCDINDEILDLEKKYHVFLDISDSTLILNLKPTTNLERSLMMNLSNAIIKTEQSNKKLKDACMKFNNLKANKQPTDDVLNDISSLHFNLYHDQVNRQRAHLALIIEFGKNQDHLLAAKHCEIAIID